MCRKTRRGQRKLKGMTILLHKTETWTAHLVGVMGNVAEIATCCRLERMVSMQGLKLRMIEIAGREMTTGCKMDMKEGSVAVVEAMVVNLGSVIDKAGSLAGTGLMRIGDMVGNSESIGTTIRTIAIGKLIGIITEEMVTEIISDLGHVIV